MLQLRDYQRACVDAIYLYLETKPGAPVAVLPTGAGKTLVIAQIASDVCHKWNGRMLILAHVKELLEQAAAKVRALDPTLSVGVYSAGLKSREKACAITVAGIQSVYERACEFDPFDLILVDEAHLISNKSDGMYQRFLKEARVVNPHLRIVGLTATPYRLDVGELCTPDGMLNEICYEIGVKELIQDGYLSKLKSLNGRQTADLSDVTVRGGEFKPDEMAEAFDTEELVDSACREIVALTEDRKGVLIFCSSVVHAEHVQAKLIGLGHEAGLVTGDTPSSERDATLKVFKGQQFKFLVNVNVLTTGFDATHVDCVVLLRATLSPGLYYQMIGRGFRLHPGKEFCVILDYGHNIETHGPVDAIKRKAKAKGKDGEATVKECPGCMYLVPAGVRNCPECGHEFPPPEPKYGKNASGAPVLSGEITDEVFAVQEVRYRSHTKRGTKPGEAPPTLRVDYVVALGQWKSEWVCVEHEGYARSKAIKWWQSRTTLPMPDTVAQAVAIAEAGGLAAPTQITYRKVSGEEYGRVHAAVVTPFEPHEEWEMPATPEIRERETVSDFRPGASAMREYREWQEELMSRHPVEDEIPF